MALPTWVDKIPNVQGGFFPVQRNPQGADFGAVSLTSPRKGVAHTTEGNTEIPPYGNNAPQLTIGKQGLYQHRAFGRMAGTLAHPSGTPPTNQLVIIQFELVEFSELVPWVPESQLQVDMMASVFEFSEQELGVPEDHVWPDEQDPGTIAVTSYRRRHSRWPDVPGWYYHAEVRDNSHWDMGDCLTTPMMKHEPLPPMVRATAIYLQYKDKHSTDFHYHSQRITPFFEKSKDASTFAIAHRKLALARAMRGKVKSAAHGDKVIDVRLARPVAVTKRIKPEDVVG